MQSMTGYGRGVASNDGREIMIELKSLNHRHLDIGMRLPRSVSQLEELLRSGIKARLARGHVELYITYRNTRVDSKRLLIDEALAMAYRQASLDIARITGAEGALKPIDYLRLSDIAQVIEGEEDAEQMTALAGEALSRALDELIRMRSIEGGAIKADLSGRLNEIKGIAKRLEARAPEVPREYARKLEERIAELMPSGIPADKERLALEIAIIADKADVAEELSRLASHIAQFEAAINADAPVGRKLDFLVQELMREANTIGSKASDAAMLELVVALKCEIERLREQVQNAE